MKTPEEIKKGLKYCWNMLDGCTGCPYERNDGECDGSMETDALAYIQQLEETVAKQNEKYKRLLETASILSDAIYEKEE